MARDVNKVELIGNLAADLQLRYTTKSGQPVTNLRVATSRQWKDKASGEDMKQTEFSRVVVFGTVAENCAKYLAKGSRVRVEGHLATRPYPMKDSDGKPLHDSAGKPVQGYQTEIVAQVVDFLDRPSDSTKRDVPAPAEEQK